MRNAFFTDIIASSSSSACWCDTPRLDSALARPIPQVAVSAFLHAHCACDLPWPPTVLLARILPTPTQPQALHPSSPRTILQTLHLVPYCRPVPRLGQARPTSRAHAHTLHGTPSTIHHRTASLLSRIPPLPRAPQTHVRSTSFRALALCLGHRH